MDRTAMGEGWRAAAPGGEPPVLASQTAGGAAASRATAGQSGMAGMEEEAYSQLRSLVQLFREHGLDELAVEDDSFKLRLSRGRPEPDGAPAVRAGSAPREPQPTAMLRPGKGRTVAVRAPLIGVFYRSAAPDAPPFVEIGDVVEEGQTVCIVEAMKVFNEIKAEWNGRVIAIPLENGTLVQAGDPLVVLAFLDGEQGEKEA
jgi:acetyl-CoA carboxylase biotin carboxyl carrier protein